MNAMNPFIINLKTIKLFSFRIVVILSWHLHLINLRIVNDTSQKSVQSGLGSEFDLIINRYNLVTARMGYWNNACAKLWSALCDAYSTFFARKAPVGVTFVNSLTIGKNFFLLLV